MRQEILISEISETEVPKLWAQRSLYMGFPLNSRKAFDIPEASRAMWKENGSRTSEVHLDRSPSCFWVRISARLSFATSRLRSLDACSGRNTGREQYFGSVPTTALGHASTRSLGWPREGPRTGHNGFTFGEVHTDPLIALGTKARITTDFFSTDFLILFLSTAC